MDRPGRPTPSRLAFTRSSGDGLTNNIWIVNADGTGLRQLTTDGTSLTGEWAPNGDQIAYTQVGPRYTYPTSVWVIGADGTGLRQLTHKPRYDGDPAWSPDGTMIAFESDRSGSYKIWTIAAAGTGAYQVTKKTASGDSQPNWRPIPR